MERDLDFKKMLKMYIKNMWLVVAVAILLGGVVGILMNESKENVLTKKVYLVYDLEKSENENLETKRVIYFDAYQGLLKGNALSLSNAFTPEEQERLNNIEVEVSSSCYTINLTVPADREVVADKEMLEKFINESETWMREKFDDDSLNVEVLTDRVNVSNSRNSLIIKVMLGAFVGAILVIVFLFVWFVLDRKVRNEDDVEFYTNLQCFSVIHRSRDKQKNDVDKIRERILQSGESVWGITSIGSRIGKTYVSQLLMDSLERAGKKILMFSIGDAINNSYEVEEELKRMESKSYRNFENKKTVVFGKSSDIERIVYCPEFINLLEVYKENYDYIVFDMKELGEHSITKRLCALCDEVILVMGMDKEDGIKVAHVIKEVSETGGNVAGIVLNEWSEKRRILRM
ncbi:hypothetical protein ABXS75_14185 [Roseburia hominis]